MEKQLNQWSKRNLTPFGKITVIKTLILSQIVHILTSLPNPSENIKKEINVMFYNFIWDKKPDKIKRKIANKKLLDGGLGMIDVGIFTQSLKLTWLRRNYTSRCKWKEILSAQQPNFNDIYRFGPAYAKLLLNNTTNKFWIDVLEAYIQLTKIATIRSIDEFKASSFMYNDNIKVDKKHINNKLLKNNGIQYIHQLMSDNVFLSYEDFTEKYRVKLSFLTYYSIIAAVSRYRLKIDPTETSTNKTKINFQPPISILFKQKKGHHTFTQK